MSTWLRTPRSTKSRTAPPHRRAAWVLAVAAAALLAATLTWFLTPSRRADEKELRALLMQPHEQKKVIRWMAGQGVPWLKKHLEGDDRLWRDAVILALGHRTGDREATELLLALCDGDDVEDAGSAVIALAIQGEPEAKDAIARSAAAGSPLLREGAVNAIVESRDESLYPLLDALAQDPDARVASAAQNTLARLRGLPTGPH